MAQVFIDGQAGTTGLEITQRLQARDDITLLTLNDAERKDSERRRACLTQADVAILCLPDDAAREAVALAAGATRIIDASTAFRTDPTWAFGLPELGKDAGQDNRERISEAQFVSNPGCYPQGFILFIRPLIEAGLISPDLGLRCNAVSGFSGGGRQMIEKRRALTSADAEAINSQTYALSLSHKHVPEMQAYSKTAVRPIFSPTVAHYYKGMLVQIPLFVSEVGGASIPDINALLAERYAGEPFVRVLPADTEIPDGYLNPTETNGSNTIELMTFGNEDQILLVARYDNLGKGAAGAAVQNMNIMLGLDEGLGLTRAVA